MADKKLFDVARPGKTMADAGSRPIIASNRPVLNDPMMIDLPKESAMRRAKTDIIPIHTDTVPEETDEQSSPIEQPMPQKTKQMLAPQLDGLTENEAYFVHIKGAKRRRRVLLVVMTSVGAIIAASIGYFVAAILLK